MNCKGIKLYSYNPGNRKYTDQKHIIAEDEVLIGVNGTLGEEDCFTRFGFIVKKKVASI